MPSNDQRKVTAYGPFCGLRSKGESHLDHDATEKAEDENVPPAWRRNFPSFQRRPQSLTLPFEKRERESHLVSEEEWDHIMTREELNYPPPPLPSDVDQSVSSVPIRQSISTARHSRFSLLSQKPRPVTEHVSEMVGLPRHKRQPSLSASQREPTLTALPRPPTTNDLLVYPNSADSNKTSIIDDCPESLHKHSATRINRALQALTVKPTQETSFLKKKGHKRNHSAAGMLESITNRLKPRNSSSSDHIQSRPWVGRPQSVNNTPAPSTHSRFHSNGAVNPSGNPDDAEDGKFQEPQETTPTSASTTSTSSFLTKSLLRRTWSRAKHTSRLSQSSPIHTTPYTSISSPIPSIEAPPPTPTISSLTQTESNTSRYDGSVEPSPFPGCLSLALSSITTSKPSTHPSTTGDIRSATRDAEIEYISDPPTRKSLRSKVGAPPSRIQLSTVVARQQSRIADLTLQNNILVNQIEILKREVEGLRRHGSTHSNLREGGAKDKELSNEVGNGEETVCVRETGLRGRRGAVSARGGMDGSMRHGEPFDPAGWRKIVGVEDDESVDHDVEMGGLYELEANMNADDKRMTWVTCESDG